MSSNPYNLSITTPPNGEGRSNIQCQFDKPVDTKVTLAKLVLDSDTPVIEYHLTEDLGNPSFTFSEVHYVTNEMAENYTNDIELIVDDKKNGEKFELTSAYPD